jgi:hypothetical protein
MKSASCQPLVGGTSTAADNDIVHMSEILLRPLCFFELVRVQQHMSVTSYTLRLSRAAAAVAVFCFQRCG